jgi:FtsP/CotA-like multicopper oxidase with cupredoxin domain
VEDPAEPADYDHDWTVVLDDWTVVLDDWIDGTGYTPDQVLDALRNGMGRMSMAAASPSPTPMMSSMGGMSGPSPVLSGARSTLLGGDVRYPWYLINGRVRTAPRTFAARPGQRARIRFINAAADTSFRVALGGHQMTVTHTDGYPVAPVRAGALLIGMGERYDVQVTLGDGVFPLTALAEGKNATALATRPVTGGLRDVCRDCGDCGPGPAARRGRARLRNLRQDASTMHMEGRVGK